VGREFGHWLKEWVPVFGPLLPLVTLVVAWVAYKAYRQKSEADRRDQWWKRVQWAIDTALEDDPQKRLVGLTVLTQLKDSELAMDEDQRLMDAVAIAVRTETMEAEGIRSYQQWWRQWTPAVFKARLTGRRTP
jgi:hypothetical protein